jgi:hypothetical protein
VCSREAWPEHKLVCDSFRDVRERAVASGASRSRSTRSFTQNWLDTVPGLTDKVIFLAWKLRGHTPIIQVTSPSANAATSDHLGGVLMLPRTQWEDANIWSSGDVITMAQSCLSSATYHVDTRYLLLECDGNSGVCNGFGMCKFPSRVHCIHSSALMTLTADAFVAEVLRRRKYPRTNTVFVRLTGLVGAAHLNGREGVLAGRDPNNSERFGVRLEDGKAISVRSQHYELVQRPKLFNEEF